MSDQPLFQKLQFLHACEESLRARSLEVLQANERAQLHIDVIESVLDILDELRKSPTEDEDLKVVRVLGMRQFNGLTSALKLALSGYYQSAAMILRDVLETVFLLDYFGTHPSPIERWRLLTGPAHWKEFKPAKIREALDRRDGFATKQRAAQYALLSELAGHASMKGIAMLKPLGGDAHMGPFCDPSAIVATLDEMGRLAVQIGEVTGKFLTAEHFEADRVRRSFARLKICWFAEFCPKSVEKLLDAAKQKSACNISDLTYPAPISPKLIAPTFARPIVPG